MALLIVIGYALLVSGLSLVFAGSVQANPVISGLIFFILAIAFLPLRQRLQHTLDTVFFSRAAHLPGKAGYLQRRSDGSGGSTLDPAIVARFHRTIAHASSAAHLYL